MNDLNDKLNTWPAEIWLQHGADELPDYAEVRGSEELTWCADNINESDVRYVRATPAPRAAPSDGVAWDRFPGWLIDHHEGEEISEHLLQVALGDMLAATPAPQGTASDTQQYRTGYGEGVRAAAKLCDVKYQARVESGHPREASTARALGEEIRNLQSTAPTLQPSAAAGEFRMVPIEPTVQMVGAGARAQLNADANEQANSLAMARAAYKAMLAAAPAASLTPAPQGTASDELETEIRKLTRWKHCMSYNDSYFGEPAGLVKCVAYQLERILDRPAASLAQAATSEPVANAYPDGSIYQIESHLKDGLYWRDTNKETYDTHYPEHRRVVYAAPPAAQQAPSEELPPLPKPESYNDDGYVVVSYTAEQMKAYARAALSAQQAGVQEAATNERDAKDAALLRWLVADPRRGYRWRIHKGKEQWQAMFDGEPTGKWGEFREVLRAALSAAEQGGKA